MPDEQLPDGLPAGFVNAWKPVTEAYKDIETPSIDQILQPPPVASTPAVPGKKRITAKLPLAIAIFGWFYMVRAAIFVVFALVLFSKPDSEFATALAQYSSLLVPFRMHRTQGQVPVDLFAEALFVTAIISVVVGGMWLMRYWRIRWVTMAYAGGSAARTLLYAITGAIVIFPPDQRQAMLAGCAVNLLIFCYLAFYPGVEQAFEDKL